MSNNLSIDTKNTWSERQDRLAKAIERSQLDGLILNPGPSLTYLTGLNFHLMERPVVAFFVPGQPVVLAIPELEAAKTANLPFPAQVFLYGEDPITWLVVFQSAAKAARAKGKLGVEPTRMRFLELRLVESAAPEAVFLSGEELLAGLRMRKSASELSLMRRAVEIAQTALLETLSSIKVGITERQIAAKLTWQMLQAGADSETPFSPIISGGPNSANPHASPSDRTFQPGDLLVIDWGAYYQGYCSDLTRTFALGEVEPELRQIAKIVQEANQAGRAAARPGVSAGAVDEAARAVIEKAGYGRYFTHRTGHGLGMEGHEGPYMRAGNPLILEPGMTFTVEPGIYLPGRNGVRIEDNLVITESGNETLSNLPRELIQLEI